MDIAQLITDRMIAELEKGATPWVKPWRTIKQAPGAGMPFNPASGTLYRGINHIWLGMQPYAMPLYVTFKQAQALGGSVKAGEKGTPVVFVVLGGQEITGQKRLRILNPPSYDSGHYRGLIGVAIWSTGECVMIGKTHWATRIGYTAIKLVQRPVLTVERQQ